MTTEEQLAGLQRSMGHVEAQVSGLREDFSIFRKHYDARGLVIDEISHRLSKLEARPVSGGLSAKTWAMLFTTLGAISGSVATVVTTLLR